MDIRIREVSKNYDGKKVLDRFSAVVKEGRCNILMGPSGCGKTTLLRILMGFEEADGGEVLGVPGRLSVVFQEDRLCEGFSAVENVALVLRRKHAEREVREHLEALGLEGSTDVPVRALSGGMRRRVAIARAVMAPADLILLDEPFKGLDDAMRERAISYFLDRTAGKTRLVVTHDAWEAARLGGEVLHFEKLNGSG